MELMEVAELYLKNLEVTIKKHAWERPISQALCALIATDKRREVDIEKWDRCRKILKEGTKSKWGLNWNFRGAAHVIMVTMLSTYDEPEQKLGEVLQLYAELRKHFSGSEYLAVAAMIVTDFTSDYVEVSARAKRLYDDMRRNHPLLTGSDDSVFTLLLALSDKSDKQLLDDMEIHFAECAAKFSKSNAVQTLSHILAMEDGSADAVIDWYEELRRRGYKYGTSFELPSLGLLTKLGERDEVIEELIQVDNFLAEQKAYTGLFKIDKKQRLMHSATLVIMNRVNTCEWRASASYSTLATIGVVVAAEFMFMVTIVACTSNN